MADTVPNLKKNDLIQPVRTSLNSDSVDVLSWDIQALSGSFGTLNNIFKVSGQAKVADTTMDWVMVLKILESPANRGVPWLGDDTDHWNYWRREALLFESGFLETIPDIFVVPHCYHRVEKPGKIIWLWMEYFDNQCDQDWSLEQYRTVAYRIGLLNGSYTHTHPLPDHTWLSQKFLDSWVGTMNHGMPYWTLPEQQMVFWEHPIIQKVMGIPEENAFYQVIQQQERVLEKLNLLPETLCHRDVWVTNLMCLDGSDQIALIDWALAGIGPVGEDLNVLIWGMLQLGSSISAKDVESDIYDQYLKGLRDSGWNGDERHIRFAYIASFVLRAGTLLIFFLNDARSKTSHEANDYLETLDDERVANQTQLLEMVLARSKETLHLLEEI